MNTMFLKMRRQAIIFSSISLFAAHAMYSNHSLAQAKTEVYPKRTINIIVPYPPGGTTDILARIVANQLATVSGQSVIVQNKAGAGGNVGAAIAAKSMADGYTLFLGTVGTQAINYWLYKNLTYNPNTDFAPIAKIAAVPNLLVSNPKEPYTSVSELIGYAKKHPGTLNFASAGTGGSTHLAGELFKSMAQIDIKHIPYKGSSAVVSDLIGGQVQITFDNLPSVIQHVKAGKLRALGVTSGSRSAALPETPSIAEAGLPGYEVMSWFGLFAPAQTPPEVKLQIELLLKKVMSSKDVVEKIQEQGGEPSSISSVEFGKFIEQENKKWKKVIETSGAQLD